MCNQQRLRSACAYAQSDQSPFLSLEYSVTVQLLTEHHLEFLSLKGGCTGSSESTLVKMPHCWKSHVTAHMVLVPRTPDFVACENFKNKGADQPVQMCRLMSTFVFHFLQSLQSRLASYKISLFKLVSITEQTGLNLTQSETLKTDFSP